MVETRSTQRIIPCERASSLEIRFESNHSSLLPLGISLTRLGYLATRSLGYAAGEWATLIKRGSANGSLPSNDSIAAAMTGRFAFGAVRAWTAHGALSNAKMRFQSFFMLMTIQPSFFASS